MNKSFNPIRVCDRDCADVNGCVIGGIRCEKCGAYFCRMEIHNGRCPDCDVSEEEDDDQP